MAEIPDNSKLRALLFAIGRATEHKDTDLLYELKKLAPEGTFDKIHIVTQDAAQEIDDENYYRVYDSAAVEEAWETLNRQAYGNFAEAARDILQDMQSPMHPKDRPLSSKDYRPEYFDKDDAAAWSRALKALEKANKSINSPSTYVEVGKLRKYLQKYHGELIPMTYMSYRIIDGGKETQQGYSFRAYKLDGEFHVTGHPDWTDEIKSIIVANGNIIAPEKVGDLELATSWPSKLFRHEL